jgi:hypothetical protein
MTEELRLPNVQAVRLAARAEWERSARKNVGIQERIGMSVPWWLVAIAVAFFALSAPHTAATFDKLTTGLGWVAPIAVELSLLYAAFRKRQIKETGERVPGGVRALEVLSFVVAILVNGAGAFMSVVANLGIERLSFAQLGGQLGTLPASSQVALMLVPLAAIIIPIGTGVAGEGVADLMLKRRETGTLLEQEWRRVRVEVEFTALRDAAVQIGHPPGRAAKWAAGLVAGMSASAQLSAPSANEIFGQVTDGQLRTGTDAGGQVPALVAAVPDNPAEHGNGNGYVRRTDARTRVREYIQTNPDAVNLSARDLAEAVGVGKTTAAEELGKWKDEHGIA